MLFMHDIINATPVISIMTRIEVLGYNNSPAAATLLNEFIEASTIIGLTDYIVDTIIEIRKNYKIKTPDAIIAASAKSLNLTLITRNVSDFKKINDLEVIDPWLV